MMKNKPVIGLIAVLVLLVGISGCVTQPSNNTSNQTVQQNITNNTTQNVTGVKIPPAEAKRIAQQYIEEPGATAGEPTLVNTDGKPTYIVPVILNGNQVGEILIDAQTGANIGGAGGAPTK